MNDSQQDRPLTADEQTAAEEHGCTIDGQPAMPILISEHQHLVTRLAAAEAELSRYTEAESADAAAGSYAMRAETAEHQRDQYAALAREVIYSPQYTEGRFANWRERLDQIGDQTAAVICELPHQTLAEEDACEARRLAARTTLYDQPSADGSCSAGQPKTEPNNPPGSLREQLPDHLLAAISRVLGTYYSTACHTATACHASAYDNIALADELREQARQLHDRCRLNQKFTGQSCVCGCHQAAPDRLAQSGIDTPGCTCGHEGMGVSWHGDDCEWRITQVGTVPGAAAAERPN